MGYYLGRARTPILATAAALAAMASSVWPAGATTPVGGSTMALSFSADTPSTPTGVSLTITYARSNDPNAKPPAVTSIAIELPAGTAVNLAAVPICRASDLMIEALGDNACPPPSKTGAGMVTAATGLGPPVDPVTGQVEIFNDGIGFVEVITVPGVSLPGLVDRVTVTGDTLKAHVATIPGGPPDLHTAVKHVAFTFPAATGYFTTPATCPRSGEWMSKALFGFADGTSQEATATTPCLEGG